MIAYKTCLLVLATFLSQWTAHAQSFDFRVDTSEKVIIITAQQLSLRLNYQRGAIISSLMVNGTETVGGSEGVFTYTTLPSGMISSKNLLKDPVIAQSKTSVTLSGIRYGDGPGVIEETWVFTGNSDSLHWDIDRRFLRDITETDGGSLKVHFNDMSVWEGSYQDYGGLAWFYLFNKPMDSYGIHSRGAKFWNTKTNHGLHISSDAGRQDVGMIYNRTANNQLAFSICTADKPLVPKYDSGTNRRLYLRGRDDVWSNQTVKAGSRHQRITFSYFDFQEAFGRGRLTGINQKQVEGVLNTIARIGVINRKHFGGNSWHTPYGPICLHEQYIAELGIGINDPAFLNGYEECLDHYRDHAIKPDGRVWSRWAYTNEDAMPGEFNEYGFYEAQWGYLMDANPDFVTNVSELFHQTGNIKWVRTHKASCEKALDWLLKRDENNNGLVEMFPADQSEEKSSDWIDIVWASYENAFVNAKLYKALVLWSEIETILGDNEKAAYYSEFAEKLAASFNKNTEEGGFWNTAKNCYVHWRDKKGGTHGNNMVTPVNFMAIAYGICRDDSRKKIILDAIEAQMEKEKLFFWPLCLYSYEAGELKDWQLPFPNYENGDIFLSWGSVAVNAYAGYKPEIAVKYIRKVLEQYEKDGLAYQRYGREKQDGRGDDILAGNCLSVVGLYQSIYGIRPKYNRFHLDPRLTPELVGTVLKYRFRDQQLTISFDTSGGYSVSGGNFSIRASTGFGWYQDSEGFKYFHKSNHHPDLVIANAGKTGCGIAIREYNEDRFSWEEKRSEAVPMRYTVGGRVPGQRYRILEDQKILTVLTATRDGRLQFKPLSKRTLTRYSVERIK